MLGLIKKDLLMLKSNIKLLAILFCVYGILTFQNEMDISFLLPVMSVIIMISTFNFDTYNKWDAYAITLPNGKENSVKAKYLATLLLMIITAILITILEILIPLLKSETINPEKIISSILGGGIATILLESLMYPAIYKFGVEKARIGIFISVFGISIFCGIISKFLDIHSLIKFITAQSNTLWILLPILLLLILYTSYKLSKKIYQKKEF